MKIINRLRKICSELEKVQNYDLASADNFNGWVLHHILGEKYKKSELLKLNLYFGRPAIEFKFLRREEHLSLHKSWCKHKDTWRMNLSKAAAGRKKSAEHKEKMRIASL